MAALYGRLRGYSKEGGAVQRNEQTAIGHRSIVARVETWTGAVEVELQADGSYVVRVGQKRGTGELVAEGQVP